MELDKDLLARQQARQKIVRAEEARQKLARLSQKEIDAIVEAMAQAGQAHSQELAKLACQETGFGNEQDKTEKNRFAAQKVYAAIRDMKTIGILREDPARGIMDVAVPVGVIGAIVPSTNPTSTVIYKALIALKAGNAIVFSPHPKAAKCTAQAAQIMAQAAEEAGCPAEAVSCLPVSTMEATQELMHHPYVRLILATGGPAMVRAAYSSGKPAIGVGPGNGPAYIHKSADIPQAVAQIILSKTFDYGTICASEQSIIVEQPVLPQVERELAAQGGYFLSPQEGKRLAAVLFRPDGAMNPQAVGKSAAVLASMAQISVPESTRVLVARETQAGPTRPYSREKLCPVLALFTEPDEDTVLEKVCQVLRHEGAGHTFVLHAREDQVIRKFACQVPVSRFLVNTPGALGGIGATTNLFPALTLGCGAVGGSSTSNNVGPMELINIRRVAAGNKQEGQGHTNLEEVSINDGLLQQITQKIMEKLWEQER